LLLAARPYLEKGRRNHRVAWEAACPTLRGVAVHFRQESFHACRESVLWQRTCGPCGKDRFLPRQRLAPERHREGYPRWRGRRPGGRGSASDMNRTKSGSSGERWSSSQLFPLRNMGCRKWKRVSVRFVTRPDGSSAFDRVRSFAWIHNVKYEFLILKSRRGLL